MHSQRKLSYPLCALYFFSHWSGPRRLVYFASLVDCFQVNVLRIFFFDIFKMAFQLLQSVYE